MKTGSGRRVDVGSWKSTASLRESRASWQAKLLGLRCESAKTKIGGQKLEAYRHIEWKS